MPRPRLPSKAPDEMSPPRFRSQRRTFDRVLERDWDRRRVRDDPVMHDDDLTVTVVRVRVALRWRAVRRPARVRDAGRAADRLAEDDGLELRDLSGGAARLDALAVLHGDARGVVAAVLETAEAVDQQWRCRPPSDVTDDSTLGQYSKG